MRTWLVVALALMLPLTTIFVLVLTPPTTPDVEREILQQIPRDGIPSIQDPVYSNGDWLFEADLVIGLEFHGEARAYSTALLSRHEIVNDQIGPTSFAVTWCPLCFTAIVFDAEVGGDHLTFGVSGNLRSNNLVMYDHQTSSLWSQAEARALEGVHRDTELEILPSRLMTWGDWRAAYPHTLALDPPGGGSGPHFDSYTNYYEDDDYFIRPWEVKDHTLDAKDLVYGVVNRGEARAYPIPEDGGIEIMHDSFEGTQLVVITFGGTGAVAYERPPGVEFRAVGDLEIESSTGETFSILSGENEDGPDLVEIPGVVIFWFAWVDHHPDTSVFGLERIPSLGWFFVMLIIAAALVVGLEVYDWKRPFHWRDSGWRGSRDLYLQSGIQLTATSGILALGLWLVPATLWWIPIGFGAVFVLMALWSIIEGEVLRRRGWVSRRANVTPEQIKKFLSVKKWETRDGGIFVDLFLASPPDGEVVGGIGVGGLVFVDPGVSKKLSRSMEKMS